MLYDNPYSNFPHVYKGVQYAIDVLEGKIDVCKWVRLACRRFFNDLDRADSGAMKFVFDPVRAERPMKFLSLMPHVKGKWRGQPLTLEPWQCFIEMNVFGWIDPETTMRRFRTADVFVPRKNGKSILAGGNGLFMFSMDGEHGAEVYSLATTMEQAWACWKPAREMTKLREKFQAKYQIRVYGGDNPTAPQAAMVRPDGSLFKPLCGTPGDSQSPSCALIDEYHEWSSDAGLSTMRTGMGARAQPLIFVISTAGDNLSSPCVKEWENIEKLLDGVFEDDTTFGIIYGLDEGDDWTTEAALKKANPNYGVSINPVGMRADQLNAIRDVKLQATFKTKHLNMWVSGGSAWLNIEKWRQCEQDGLKIEDFKGAEAHVSADAASKLDLHALTAIIKREGKTYFFARGFIPSETADAPENKHYKIWADQGWLTIIDGSRIDQSVVEKQLQEWNALLNIRDFSYDPREMNQLALNVQKWASFPLVEITQSPANLSFAYKEFEALVNSAQLVVQTDPCLRWQASNCQLKEAKGGGPTKLYFVTKPNHQSKIDGIVSGCMGVSRAMLAPDQNSGFVF